MSYSEKKTITNMLVALLILIVYCVYASEQFKSGMIGGEDLRAWAKMMLVFIGVNIGAMIIVQILFHIGMAVSISVQETILQGGEVDNKDISRTIDATIVEDEMDKLINLKSNTIGYAIVGLGFVVGLVTLVAELPTAIMLNVVFIACFLSTLAEGIAALIYYRKGVRHG